MYLDYSAANVTRGADARDRRLGLVFHAVDAQLREMEKHGFALRAYIGESPKGFEFAPVSAKSKEEQTSERTSERASERANERA